MRRAQLFRAVFRSTESFILRNCDIGVAVFWGSYLESYKEIPVIAEWIHFTLLGIISPTIKLKVYTFGGL